MTPEYLTHRESPQTDESRAEELARAKRIVESFLRHGVDFVLGVPDNQSRALYELLRDESRIQVVPVCREGEAFAVASGLYAGGRCPALVIQNTGMLESGDSFRGTAWGMGIPLVCLVGYRGYKTKGTPNEDSVATLTEPTLEAWRLPYRIMSHGQEQTCLEWAFGLARKDSHPVALLVV